MNRVERRGNRMKNNGPINHANKTYSLTVKDRVEQVSSTLSNNRMMDTRVNENTHNVIDE